MPILSGHSLEVISRSTEQTRRVGMRLGSLLQTGYVVALLGELGSGKTTFVQGIGSGWGSLDPVSSPSFVLVNVYRRPDGTRLFHLDAFRINGPGEAIDLDLEMMLQGGPLVIEWADRIRAALPEDCLQVRFTYVAENQRDMVFNALGHQYETLLIYLRKGIYGG